MSCREPKSLLHDVLKGGPRVEWATVLHLGPGWCHCPSPGSSSKGARLEMPSFARVAMLTKELIPATASSVSAQKCCRDFLGGSPSATDERGITQEVSRFCTCNRMWGARVRLSILLVGWVVTCGGGGNVWLYLSRAFLQRDSIRNLSVI